MTEQLKKSELFGIRHGRVEDHNFIYASWLRSLYFGDSWVSCIPKDIFMRNYHDIIEKLLANSLVKIVYLKDKDLGTDDIIVAYAILSPDQTAIHYAYTKKSWRKIGLIKSLLSPQTTVATELTDIGRSYIKNHPNMVFNPFGAN